MSVKTRPAEVAGAKRIVSEILFSHSDSHPRGQLRTPPIQSFDRSTFDTRNVPAAFTAYKCLKATTSVAVSSKPGPP
jgi:hypothetical protein